MEYNIILEKANQILIEKRLKQRKQFHKAKNDKRIIEAGLCPCCGENLNISDDYSYIKNYLKENQIHSGYDYYNSLKVCQNDKNHFIQIEGEYWDDDD